MSKMTNKDKHKEKAMKYTEANAYHTPEKYKAVGKRKDVDKLKEVDKRNEVAKQNEVDKWNDVDKQRNLEVQRDMKAEAEEGFDLCRDDAYATENNLPKTKKKSYFNRKISNTIVNIFPRLRSHATSHSHFYQQS